jgi:cytochrome P450
MATEHIVGAEIVPFDYLPMGGVKDPYPTYAAMREAGRVLRTPFGALIVHRYEDVRHAHADHDALSMSALGPAAAGAVMGPMAVDRTGMDGEESFLAETMLTADPPDHERLRRVVNRAFTPRSIAAIEPRVREIARELLAPLAAGEEIDLVADFAGPLPTVVIAELLGIPAEDADQFRLWTEAVTGTDVRGRTSATEAQRYGHELRRYLAGQIERRKHAPTDDLIGRMVVANEDEIMSDAEVVASCVLLLIAGNETTMRLITNMTLALGRFPDQLERLVADPELIPSGVEETLRYDSPVQMLFRAAKQDTTIGAVEIPEGSFVLTLFGAANRDPEAFTDPDVYDVGRQDNLHTAFGHGIHYCLGAPLARREARLAFEELLQVAPGLRVLTTDDELEYPASGTLRSPRSLVVSG